MASCGAAVGSPTTTGAASGFQLVSTTVLKRADGTLFDGQNPGLLNGNKAVLGNSIDSEGIARRANGNFLISDEYGPSIYEFKADGTFVRAFKQPNNLVPRENNGTLNYVDGRGTIATGRQDNRGYEGLTISRDGRTAFAILQDPLVNEGRGDQGRRSQNLRIVRFDIASGEATGQFIYQLEHRDQINARIPGTANDFSENDQGRSIGVSSITQLADGSFLVIERDNRGLGEADPTGAGLVGSKRVYRIRLDGATDVTNVSLAGSNTLPTGVVPVSKSLYLDVQAQVGAANVTEKLEGLTFGRTLGDGSLSLLLISDNDMSVTQGDNPNRRDVCTSGFGGVSALVQIGDPCPLVDGVQTALIPTSIYAFRVAGASAVGVVPEPASWALMIAGFGLAGVAVRRRGLVRIA